MKEKYIAPIRVMRGELKNGKLELTEKILQEKANFHRNLLGVLLLDETNNPMYARKEIIDIIKFYIEKNPLDTPSLPFVDKNELKKVGEKTKEKKVKKLLKSLF